MSLEGRMCLWGNGHFPSEFLTTILEGRGNTLETSRTVGRGATASREGKKCSRLAESHLFQPLMLPDSPLSLLFV